ncbi:hypothetical protein PFISCL1PPCAC_24352, partial [Pristionchus fissidentatus]
AMTNIIEEVPYAAIVANLSLEVVCSGCFVSNSSSPLSRCVKCKILYYCGPECQKRDWKLHKEECKFMASFSRAIPSANVRLMARLLIRRKKGDETKVKAFNGRTFEDLMHHSTEYRAVALIFDKFKKDAKELKKYVSKEFIVDDKELLKYYGKMQINRFGIVGSMQMVVGEGIYLGLSELDHSCSPDAYVRFRGSTAILRSPMKGRVYSNQLTVSYIEVDAPKSERWRKLNKYFFQCNCAMCQDEEKDGYARSIRCEDCSFGICRVTERAVLDCDSCGAVSRVTVENANTANENVLDLNVKLWNGNASDFAYALRYYNAASDVLSEKNIPLAVLARHIANYHFIHDKFISIPLVHSFADALCAHIPIGSPERTYTLLAAMAALSNTQSTPGRDKLRRQTDEAVFLSHGTLEEGIEKGDEQIILLYKLIKIYDNRNA